MKLNKKIITKYFAISLTIILVTFSSCKKFVIVDPPITSVNGATVFTDDLSAASVLTGIYYTFMQGQSGNIASLYGNAGLSSDELTLYNFTSTTFPGSYYTNKLSANVNSDVKYWGSTYTLIYRTNEAIEGLNNAVTLTPAVKQQLLGEAKFLRAFFYFYLVNLYGDVPLALSSDYRVNNTLSRASTADVYTQIISDLKDAKIKLSDNYVNSNGIGISSERVRPNKGAAIALLARAYLFVKDYSNAELEASEIINKNNLYELVTLSSVFLKNSKETIWALQPTAIGRNTNIAVNSILAASGPNTTIPFSISDALFSSFENNDNRKTSWIGTITPAGKIYRYAFKYKVSALNQPVTEYTVVFRLAEQYLIRAEARANLGKILGLNSAESDLNLIRLRAGLQNTPANTQSSILTAIEKERQVELFTEWGHRWLDLKRTGRIDNVMSIIAPLKTGVWRSEWQFYPLPIGELRLNTNLKQNAGYEQ